MAGSRSAAVKKAWATRRANRTSGSASVAGRYARRFGVSKAAANTRVKTGSAAGAARRLGRASGIKTQRSFERQLTGARANAVARFGAAGAAARNAQAKAAKSLRVGRTSSFARSLTPNLHAPRRAYGTSASKASGRRG